MSFFTLESTAMLPTRAGHFRVVAFTPDAQGREHLAVIRGDLDGAEDVPVRMHSECLTGDVLGSLRCDCRDQLQRALDELGQEEKGVVLYLRQEGRGIGLVNKIRAYSLQDDGADTVDANLLLGFEEDERDYEVAARMLKLLGIRSIRLKTNNPDKVAQLRWYGMHVRERIPHEVPSNDHNARYLAVKRTRCGHLLEEAVADCVAAK